MGGDAPMFIAHSRIARDLDDRLLEARCPCCGRLLSVTLYEVRTGKAVPCPNCEAWVPLWDVEGTLQALHDLAVIVDDSLAVS
jgi:hypothetical protein